MAARSPGRWTTIALTALVFALLWSRAMCRNLDLDEHQFVAPPTLLNQGYFPYTDYPCFHMPTLTYVYAVLFRFTSMPLLAARTFSAGCGTCLLLALFLFSWRLLAPFAPPRVCWTVAAGLPLTFLSSRLFTYTDGWAWNHDSAALCCLLAFLAHMRALRTGRIAGFGAAGLLLALAVGIRISYLFVFVPLGLSLLLGPTAELTPRKRLAGLGLAVTAALIGFVPALVPLVLHPDEFLFCNLGFPKYSPSHFVCAATLSRTPIGKVMHLFQTMLSDPGNAGLSILFVVAAGCAAVRGLRRRGPHLHEIVLLWGILLAHLPGVWAPTPTFYQYYYQLMPSAILFVVYAIAAEAADPRTANRALRLKRWTNACAAVTLIAAATGLPRWYLSVTALFSPDRWVPVQVHRTGLWVASRVPAGTEVLTIDPIIPLDAGVRVYPEHAVGRIALMVGPFMSPEVRGRYRIAAEEEFERMLRVRPARAVLIGRVQAPMAAPLERYAQSRGFVAQVSPDGEFVLWTAPKAQDSPLRNE